MPVYIIQAGDTDMVKIGWAIDPEGRRNALQCGHHERLHIIRLIDGERRVEGWLHRKFKAHRVRNEWYRLDPAMLTVAAAEITPEPRVSKVSAETRHRISRSMYHSWQNGSLRRTFDLQRTAA